MFKYALSWVLLAGIAAAQNPAPAATPDALVAKARQTYTQQGPAAALPDFERALELYRAAGDRRGEAVVLGYIANCQRRSGNLTKALDLARQALQMKEGLGDRVEIGKTYNQLGLIHWEMADYPAAIKEFQEAIAIGRTAENRELEGSALNNLGLVFDELGDYHRSLSQYQRALDLHRAAHFERGEGDTLGNIGGVYLLLGRFGEALPYYRQALAISERLELKPAASDDLGNIALCLAGIGNVQESLATFDRALQVAREAGLPKEEADWHRGKATTLVGIGRYDAALREYAEAQSAYERSGLKRELAAALDDTGNVYELLGDTTAADKQYHRSLELAEGISNAQGVITNLIAIGELHRRRKQYAEAESQFSRALELAKAAQDTGSTAAALIARAANDMEWQKLDGALESAAEAARVSELSGNVPAQAHSHYLLGEVRRSRGELQPALAEYAAAETLQKRLGDPELGWRLLYGRGQVTEALGKLSDAVEAYKASVRIIEQTRAGISEERFRAGYIEDRYQVYVALVELLLKLGRTDDAFAYSERLRARAYLDQFGGASVVDSDTDQTRRLRELSEQIHTLRRAVEKEWSVPEKQRRGEALETFSTDLAAAERAYQDALDDARNSRRSSRTKDTVLTTADVQRLLPRHTALIEYLVGKRSITILLLTSESVFGTAVPVRSESLSSRVELLRGLILGRRAEWIQPARGLYTLLLEPLEKKGYLNGMHQLLIIPDGVLNYVPFAALPGKTSRLVVEDFAVAYLPAAAALNAHAEDRPDRRTLLAMAPASAHLPYAAAEIRGIGQMFPTGSRLVYGTAATKTLFERIAGDYDYVHLATHGSLNHNAPWLSMLQLESDNKEDGRLELYEILNLKLHARLVTLSACETALGSGYFTQTPAGNEFVGMTRAFLGAGSRAVLASLWAVSDESTRLLMVGFYRHLLDAGGAEALAQAQRELRRTNTRYHHPYYWSAFVLVGGTK